MERVSIVIAAEYRFGMETYSKSTCMREMESLGLEAELVRKRRKKDDLSCANLEKQLEEEIFLLKHKRRSQPIPGSASRAYTHDTSIRKAGTTKPKARLLKQRINQAPPESSSIVACKFLSVTSNALYFLCSILAFLKATKSHKRFHILLMNDLRAY